MRVLIAAGGTVGHVAPALVVADELVRRGADVIFAGTPNRVEAELVPARGYRFLSFPVAGIERRLSRRSVVAAGLAAGAPVRCGLILRKVRPDVVYGAGGYVAGPMVAAAAAQRIPAVLTETDAHLGLANRLAAPLARVVLLATPIAGCDPPKYRVVGRPVDPAFMTTTRSAGRAAFGFGEHEPVLAIVGGSLGSGALNEAAFRAFGERDTGITVVHVAGRGKLAGLTSGPRYRVLEFSDRMPELLAAADLVIARAGGFVYELAAAGRPAILVPWSGATGDHQYANARRFADAGAAVLIRDDDLDADRLTDAVQATLGDPARLAAMASAMRTLATPNAAAEIADELERLARERR